MQSYQWLGSSSPLVSCSSVVLCQDSSLKHSSNCYNAYVKVEIDRNRWWLSPNAVQSSKCWWNLHGLSHEQRQQLTCRLFILEWVRVIPSFQIQPDTYLGSLWHQRHESGYGKEHRCRIYLFRWRIHLSIPPLYPPIFYIFSFILLCTFQGHFHTHGIVQEEELNQVSI